MIPHSLFPPDPTRIGEYIGAGFELGVAFAQGLVTVITDFIGALGKFMV